jgi:hypothetical protein
MARFRWVQINGKLVPADEVTAHEQAGPTILADLPDFRSPIDGSIVRGRAGMRDHCARHDVVPTAELAGLPFKRTYQETPPSKEYREATKRTIADIINSKY